MYPNGGFTMMSTPWARWRTARIAGLFLALMMLMPTGSAQSSTESYGECSRDGLYRTCWGDNTGTDPTCQSTSSSSNATFLSAHLDRTRVLVEGYERCSQWGDHEREGVGIWVVTIDPITTTWLRLDVRADWWQDSDGVTSMTLEANSQWTGWFVIHLWRQDPTVCTMSVLVMCPLGPPPPPPQREWGQMFVCQETLLDDRDLDSLACLAQAELPRTIADAEAFVHDIPDRLPSQA